MENIEQYIQYTLDKCDKYIKHCHAEKIKFQARQLI